MSTGGTSEQGGAPAAATPMRRLMRDILASSPVDGRLLFLDGWRGMAILFVLLGHFAALAPAKLAGAGVECFFVLSGRLMAEILVVRRHPLPSFLARRASRILPALAFFVLAMLVLMSLTASFDSPSRSWVSAIAALGFVHNYLPAEHVAPLFEHSWSLAVEEHSYLLLALLVLLTARSARLLMAAALLIVFIAFVNGIRLGAITDPGDQYAYWRTDVRAASIFLSFAFFIWAHRYFAIARDGRWAFASPACLLAGLILLLISDLPPYARFGAGTAFLAVAVATLDVAHPRFRRLFESPSLVWLGVLSYSLYLWQQPFYMLTRGGASLLMCVTGALAFALLSFHWVERPARNRLNALASRKRPRTRAPETRLADSTPTPA